MNTNRDGLDDAIDLVTARMTKVEKDPSLAARIADALPDRSAWFPRVWIARLAMGALATIAISVVLPRLDSPTGVGPAKAGPHTVAAGHQLAGVGPAKSGHRAAGAGPAEAGPHGTSVVSAFRRTNNETMIDHPDHEFSLAPIDDPDTLSLTALTPSELALEPALVLAPLEITDLPLSSDFSPR